MTELRQLVTETRAEVASLPLPLRLSLTCALVLGTVGASCGLVLGLVAHPPTAWAAVLEVGVPAAIVGWVGGLAVGVLLWLARAERSSR